MNPFRLDGCGGLALFFCPFLLFTDPLEVSRRMAMQNNSNSRLVGAGERIAYGAGVKEKCAFPVRKRIKRSCHLSRPVSRGVGNEDRLRESLACFLSPHRFANKEVILDLTIDRENGLGGGGNSTLMGTHYRKDW